MVLLFSYEDGHVCADEYIVFVLFVQDKQTKCAKRQEFAHGLLHQCALHGAVKPGLLHVLLLADFSRDDPDVQTKTMLLPHLDLGKLRDSISNFLFGYLAQKYYSPALPYKTCNIRPGTQLGVPAESLRRLE